MKVRDCFAVVLLLLGFGFVHAQDLFGDLSWSDSPQVVHKKLAAMGYGGFSMGERAKCVVESSCYGSFAGPSVLRGRVAFSKGAMWSVRVETGNFNSALASLTRKYGQPGTYQSRNHGSVLRNRLLESGAPRFEWVGGAGATISLHDDGTVSYLRDPRGAEDSRGMRHL